MDPLVTRASRIKGSANIAFEENMKFIWLFAPCLFATLAPFAQANGIRCANQGCDGQCYRYPPPENLDCQMGNGCIPIVPTDPSNPTKPATPGDSKNRSPLQRAAQQKDPSECFFKH